MLVVASSSLVVAPSSLVVASNTTSVALSLVVVFLYSLLNLLIFHLIISSSDDHTVMNIVFSSDPLNRDFTPRRQDLRTPI